MLMRRRLRPLLLLLLALGGAVLVSYVRTRGPIVMHNVTVVAINRIHEGGRVSFHRDKSNNSEVGWKLLPDLAVGARVNLHRTEDQGLAGLRATNSNDFQGSLRSH